MRRYWIRNSAVIYQSTSRYIMLYFDWCFVHRHEIWLVEKFFTYVSYSWLHIMLEYYKHYFAYILSSICKNTESDLCLITPNKILPWCNSFKHYGGWHLADSISLIFPVHSCTPGTDWFLSLSGSPYASL